MIDKGSIVTVDVNSETSSNTYIVHEKVGDKCFLYHPIFPECFIEKNINELNKIAARIKDSTERGLNFALNSKKYLDYNTLADLEALCLYFSIRRKLTPRQKHLLSTICGTIASIKLNNNTDQAIKLIIENEGLLDDFNKMWYHNFRKLFNGQQVITSKKQRSSIFNIAGFVFAELNYPITERDSNS